MQTTYQTTALSFVVDRSGDITESFFQKTRLGSMASARIQLLPAIQACRSLGSKVKVLSLHSADYLKFKELSRSNLCLIGKMSTNSDELALDMTLANISAVARLKRQKCKIVVQYCDNILQRNDLISSFYKDLFQFTDHIIYPSLALKEITSPSIPDHIEEFIIHDPWQVINSRKIILPEKNNFIRIVWFGSNKNIDYLLAILELITQSLSIKFKYELTILGQKWALNRAADTVKKFDHFPKNWRLRLVPWKNGDQPFQLDRELGRAHISFIPSDPNDPKKSGVSHNRLVDSLRGGCLTVASPMKSYLELSEVSLQGDNLIELLQEAVINFENYCNEFNTKKDGQIEKFNPKLNSRTWENFFKSI